MAINGIQFQKGLSLSQFMKNYGTEEQCQAVLKLARLLRGFERPRRWHGEAFDGSCTAMAIEAGQAAQDTVYHCDVRRHSDTDGFTRRYC